MSLDVEACCIIYYNDNVLGCRRVLAVVSLQYNDNVLGCRIVLAVVLLQRPHPYTSGRATQSAVLSVIVLPLYYHTDRGHPVSLKPPDTVVIVVLPPPRFQTNDSCVAGR